MATAQKPMADPYAQPNNHGKAMVHATAPTTFPLRQVIEAHRDVISPLCTNGISVESVIAQLWIASRKSPDILKATPESLVPAISRALEVGGVIGRDVHILTFKDNRRNVIEATDCLDFKFMVELVVAAGGARSVDARIVYANDQFNVEYGTNPHIHHIPAGFGKDRGAMIGAYAVAFIGASTPPKFVALRMEQIETIRKKSKQWNEQKIGACPEWYAAKTAVRQLVKLLPKNPKLARAMEVMDRDERVADAEEIEAVVTMPAADEIRPPDVSADGEDLTYDDSAEVDAASDAQLADALAHVVNKQALGTLRNSGIKAVLAWARKKMDEDGESEKLATIAHHCGLIIDARALGVITEPAKEAA